VNLASPLCSSQGSRAVVFNIRFSVSSKYHRLKHDGLIVFMFGHDGNSNFSGWLERCKSIGQFGRLSTLIEARKMSGSLR
jgi:hypothetical protein